MSGLSKFYSSLVTLGNYLQPYFLLAIRLFWGWMFFKAGFAKLQDMEKVIGYFGKMGFPLPAFSAYLAAIVELLGGLSLMIGFASRLMAIPLIITMLVALLAVHDGVSLFFTNSSQFLAQGPVTYLLAALTIFFFGPGTFSVDAATKIEPPKS